MPCGLHIIENVPFYDGMSDESVQSIVCNLNDDILTCLEYQIMFWNKFSVNDFREEVI